MTLILSGANVIMGRRLYNVIDGTNRPHGYITAASYGKNTANYRWEPENGHRLATPEELAEWTALVSQAERFKLTRRNDELRKLEAMQAEWNNRFN